MTNSRLKKLRDYFPTAIFTGRALVFISEESRVELTEHMQGALAGGRGHSVIRVHLFYRTAQGEFAPGHYEDFELEDMGELAQEVEKFVQAAVGKNIKES